MILHCISKLIFDTLLWAWGAFKSVKDLGNIIDWNPKWAWTLQSLIYFSWDIYRDPLPSTKKTPCCGFEVQKPTQALKSFKDTGNTFDLNPKWSRTLPSLINFSWDINRDQPSIKKIKYQSWYLTPSCGLDVLKPTQALRSVKGPGNTFDLIPMWSRTLPSLIYFS